jgi:hypothetical protein
MTDSRSCDVAFGRPNANGHGHLFPDCFATSRQAQSCVSISDCPAPRFPEFAVIGRSNVGKSSIINMLTGRKDLALVSKQPGGLRILCGG